MGVCEGVCEWVCVRVCVGSFLVFPSILLVFTFADLQLATLLPGWAPVQAAHQIPDHS